MSTGAFVIVSAVCACVAIWIAYRAGYENGRV